MVTTTLELGPTTEDGTYQDDRAANLPDDDVDLVFTDEELAALAMAADVDQPVADDAVPFDMHSAAFGDLLPDWYMPAPAAHRVGRSRTVVGAVIILSLVLVNAVGLCVTYGSLAIAW
jgi:hypothetical protein